MANAVRLANHFPRPARNQLDQLCTPCVPHLPGLALSLTQSLACQRLYDQGADGTMSYKYYTTISL